MFLERREWLLLNASMSCRVSSMERLAATGQITLLWNSGLSPCLTDTHTSYNNK